MEGRVKREERARQKSIDLTMEKNNLDSRIHLLSEMEKENEGFNKAVSLIMQAAEKPAFPTHRTLLLSLRTADITGAGKITSPPTCWWGIWTA